MMQEEAKQYQQQQSFVANKHKAQSYIQARKQICPFDSSAPAKKT